MVPHPYGGAPYILLGHLLHAIFPNHLPAAMTILLSALPAAVTVGLTYFIVARHVSPRVGLVACCLLVGSTIFLARATTLCYHSLAIMLITLTYYLYDNHKVWAGVTAGLAVGVHPMTAPILGLWLLVRREWSVAIPIAAGVAVLGYSVIILLMWLPTPPLLAGKLSWHTLIQYFAQTPHAIVGQLSVFEAPRRLLLTSKLLLLSLGTGLVALGYAIRKPLTTLIVSHLSTIIFVLWYFFTCMDVMTWPYLAFMAPSAAILVGVGLARLPKFHTTAVLAYSIVLIVLNPLFMNANVLTQQQSAARNYMEELGNIPQNSIVVTTAGACSLGLFYYIADHPGIMPLVYPYLEYSNYFPTEDYRQYLANHYYQLDYSSTLKAVQDALDRNIPVYYTNYPEAGPILAECFITEDREGLVRVIALSGKEPRL